MIDFATNRQEDQPLYMKTIIDDSIPNTVNGMISIVTLIFKVIDERFMLTLKFFVEGLRIGLKTQSHCTDSLTKLKFSK